MKSVLKHNLVILALLLAYPTGAQALDIPSAIPYQGHLTDAGGINLTSNLPIEIRLYDSLIAGLGQGVTNSHVIYAERHDAIHIENGNFRLKIGEGTPLDARWTGLPVEELVSKENLYLELWIDGERLSPRQKMGSVPAVIKAQGAKFADSLTHLPTITPDMMPAYDASLITSGVFKQSQIPPLTPAWFTGKLDKDKIPNIGTDKFDTASGTKISPDHLPDAIDAGKITGSPLSVGRFPSNIVLDLNIAIGSGTIRDNEMIVVPSDFTAEQCKIIVAPGSLSFTAEDGLVYLNASLNSSSVVSCNYYGSERRPPAYPKQQCYVNYLYICKK